MKHFKNIAAITLSIALLAGAVFPAFTQAANDTFRVVESPTVSLYTSEAPTNASLTVTPLPTDLDGNALTMTAFGTNPTLTVDPGLTGYEEIESFTGITNNGNNTATLTGLTRDLASTYPYTASGTGKQHGSGAVVVFSNNPQIYGRLGALENDQGWTGINQFNVSPIINDANSTSTSQAASRNYVNGVAILGSANGSLTVNGIYQEATGAQAAAGTPTGSTAADLALSSRIATSTPYNSGSSVIPVTGTNEKLSQLFLDLTQAFTVTGQWTFNSLAPLFNAGFVSSASTTIAASSGKMLTLNGVPYAFPASQCANGQTLQNDGSGNLSCATIPHPYAHTDASNIIAQNSTATTTELSIPANTLTASSTITINAWIICGTSSSLACNWSVRDSTGKNFISFSKTLNGNYVGPITIVVTGTGSASQATCARGFMLFSSGSTYDASGQIDSCTTSSIAITNATSIAIVANTTSNSATAEWETNSIVINP